MKNHYDKCRKLALYFLILFSCVVVGYAMVTQILEISGTSNVTGTWDVKITDIGTGTLTNAENESAPTYTDTTATFNVNLQAPGATAIYPITVKNNGNIKAKLASIGGITEANSAAPTDVTFACTAAVNDTLNADETKIYNVTVVWDADATTIPETTTKTAAITLHYEQIT